MDAFVEWMNSTEPAKPWQAALILLVFAATTCFNLWLACRRPRNKARKEA